MNNLEPTDLIKAFSTLKSIALKLGVELEEVESDFFGDFASAGFCYADSIIRYSEELKSDMEKLIYVVSHELGHALDFFDMEEDDQKQFLDSVRFYNECVMLQSEFPFCVRDFVLNSEFIACEYADLLVGSLGIAYRRSRARRIRADMMSSYRLMFE